MKDDIKEPLVLVVDDEESIREGLRNLLELEGFSVETAADGREALHKTAEFLPDAAVVDLKMPNMDGHTFLKEVKHIDPELPVIFLTGHGTIEDAVKAMQNGAYDFITKPPNTNHLILLIKRAINERNLKRENKQLKERIREKTGLEKIVGESPAIRKVKEQIKLIAPTDATVLITGESGTGKELVAEAIHQLSPRRNGPFVKVSCAALPETLLESELFGHEKGAFTGAVSSRKGRFELANGGTIFLDEIGEISPRVQVKLLRVIQEKEFERVGGEKTIKVDIRIITATNRDLEKEVKKGNFREDLYYRLRVINIHLPPLRERKEDIPLLLNHFLEEFSKRYSRNIKGFTQKAVEILTSYDWPGNIRELQNVVESCVVLAQGEWIDEDDLPSFIKRTPHPAEETEEGDYIKIPIGTPLKEVEKRVIVETLLKNNGNKAQTARQLGIGRKTLFRKLEEFGIKDMFTRK